MIPHIDAYIKFFIQFASGIVSATTSSPCGGCESAMLPVLWRKIGAGCVLFVKKSVNTISLNSMKSIWII